MTKRNLLTCLVLVILPTALLIFVPTASGPVRSGPDRPSPDVPELLTDGTNVVDVKFMLRGYCHAGSRIMDPKALGGFASSANYARPIRTAAARAAGQCYLLAQPKVPMPFGGGEGMRLVLVNPTGKAIPFPASDGRLSILQEALDASGVWKPIEYLPSSWCGNSYHRVFLGPDELVAVLE